MKKTLFFALFGAFSMVGCGVMTTPQPTLSGSTPEVLPDFDFKPQGTPIVCSNQSAGGNFPYNLNGPLWRQQFFLNDNGTPLNYSTFSTDLPATSNISMNAYTVNTTGGSYTPQPWMYQHVYAPNVILTGTQTNGAAANNIVVTASGNYGLLYNASLKQFDLPVVSSSNKFKLFDATGNLQPTEYGGSQTYYPSINNGRVRIPTGQKVTLEFYLDPKVQYRKEMIWANFKDASGVSKTDWVTVNMPYQEGILKVNAATYTVQEATGIKTYQSAVNPLPKFKFVMRGYNNLVSADRQFLSRQGIYYTWPSSVPSGNWAAWNQFMDERKDYVLNWNLYDQKVGSASVDASGDPVVNAATVTTPAQWNLGTPGYANDKNCISKTFAPESGSQQRFSVIQPAATVFSGATFTETQQGLKAEYFDNPDFTGKRVERLNSQINFNWGGYSPAPFISPETYSIRWSGMLKAPVSGRYTLSLQGGTGVRLVINRRELIHVTNSNPSVNASASISLQEGDWYPIVLEYHQGMGQAGAVLNWIPPGGVSQPVPANALSPISRLVPLRQTFALNEYLALALDPDGKVWVWGSNQYGGFGNGQLSSTATSPSQVNGLDGIREIVVESGFSNPNVLALKAEGSVWSWGPNSNGQVGNGTRQPQLTPQKIAGLANVVRIRIGYSVAFAIDATGQAWHWGNTVTLSNGGFLYEQSKLVPEPVPGISDVADIVSLGAAYVILKKDGTLWSYGPYNTNGILGDGTSTGTPHFAPTHITFLSNVVAIAGGPNIAYAVTADGKVWTWGKTNEEAGSTVRYAPVQVVSSSGSVFGGLPVIEVVANDNRAATARTIDGTIWTWGYQGGDDLLGDNTSNYRGVPKAISGRATGQNYVGLTRSFRAAFALGDNGQLYGWGKNFFGILGNLAHTNADGLYIAPLPRTMIP